MQKHIYLIGICGTAMASLAGMLKQQGHEVTGSDAAAYPPMSELLQSLGITVHEPYSERNLDRRPDIVVVGNAISRGNVELERVLDERIPFCSMATSFWRVANRLWWLGRMGKQQRRACLHGSTRRLQHGIRSMRRRF
jgi:UDP-N-acetylmuramate-alanine ligase